MELTTRVLLMLSIYLLFMMSKIQNLNGTHNCFPVNELLRNVVYDVKDTKFEWNSQPRFCCIVCISVVYDVKDTKFEWNSQRLFFRGVNVYSCL